MKANPQEAQESMRRFFAGVTEHAFVVRLGVADPPMIDYVANMLVRFVRCDAVYRIRDLAGRRLEEIARMMMEAEERIGEARREVHRHVGDFTLFWSGLYPEALEPVCRGGVSGSGIGRLGWGSCIAVRCAHLR